MSQQKHIFEKFFCYPGFLMMLELFTFQKIRFLNSIRPIIKDLNCHYLS